MITPRSSTTLSDESVVDDEVHSDDGLHISNQNHDVNKANASTTNAHSIEDTVGKAGGDLTISNVHPYDDNEYEDDEDSISSDSDVEQMTALPSGKKVEAPVSRKISKTNASSLIGGSSVKSGKISPGYREPSHKIFSFSLPFGNLSSLTNNLSKQLSSFNLNSPLSSSFTSLHSTPVVNKEALNLKLSKQESISTIEEEYLFRNFKGIDSSRLRAVKRAIKPNISYGLITKTKPKYETVFDDIDGNIVVLGGYRGSILRDAQTHKRIWIPIKAGFNLRKINLLLGPSPEDEVRASDYIFPDGILKNIGPVDICKKLLRKLDNGKTNLKEYGYDWRLSSSFNSVKFEEYLTKLYEETKKPILVIAHSMGGIIAHSVLNRSPHLFRGIVYVGVPSECPNILGPIRFGDNVLLSSKILTPEANFMMRSSYVFLPLSGRLFVDTKTKKRIDMDFFDPDVWVEFNLNPLVAKERKLKEEQKGLKGRETKQVPDTSIGQASTVTQAKANDDGEKIDEDKAILDRFKSMTHRSFTDSLSLKSFNLTTPLTSTQVDDVQEEYSVSFSEAYNYLAATLKDTKQFLLDLEYRSDLDYPPLAIVYGNKVPSVRGCNINDLQDVRDGKYFNFFYGHGDGVIHQKWLLPERRGFPVVGKFSSDCGHVSLMTDSKAMGNALYSILSAENKKRKENEKNSS